MTSGVALRRFGAVASGFASAAGGAMLAWFHPLYPVPLLGAFGLALCACMAWRSIWLFAVPALLPLAGLASWSGWLTFEEFDLLLLAAAAGCYLRLALDPAAESAKYRRVSPIALVLVALYGVTMLFAMQRGFADAGGFHFGWFQGYEEPMNSLRIGKSFFFALLLLPLALREAARSGTRLTTTLSMGMLAGLTLAAMACVWEREAFPGLLNFSEDYRTTALFWEMHVGGAALDGFLALTLPFALREVLVSRNPLRLAISLALLGVASYVCLTTFSRGVYLGVGLGVGLLLTLLHARGAFGGKPAGKGDSALSPARLVGVVMVAVAACYLGFRSGGYRAMLSVLLLFAVTLLSGAMLRCSSARILPGGLALGGFLAALATAFALLASKGAYLSFAAAFAACLGLLWRQRGRENAESMLFLASYLWLAVSALLVGYIWGGEAALLDMLVALPLILGLAIWNTRAPRPVWPVLLRWQGGVFAVVLMLSGAVAIFGGGAYMSGRFSTSGQDLEGRIAHWNHGIDLLQSSGDWWFGKGLGRFPANYFFSSRSGEYPGGYRLEAEGENRFLRLSGARYAIGYGEYLRISQRVPASGGRYRLEFDARTPRESVFHFEICEKHLLYRAGCAMADARVKPDAHAWQHVAIEMDGKDLWGGHWYAPRLAFFAVALDTAGAVADVDNFRLTNMQGESLLANGNFTNEMAHWFFTSDHHHLPWHIKNLLLNVLFEEGVIGLILFVVLYSGALWRVTLGSARDHPAAPYLAAALAGCLVVGGFDSLLDVPRVAFLIYFLMLLSLALNGAPSGRTRRSHARHRRMPGDVGPSR